MVLFKGDVRKKAFTVAFCVLRVDLDPEPGNLWRLFAENVSVIFINISVLGNPFTGFVPA